MKVTFFDNIHYQLIPETENAIEIDCTMEELIQVGITKQYDKNTNTLIDYVNVEERILELKQQLEHTDYQAIKYAEGLITAEEYAPIKAQRQAWRNEINELEKEVS